MGSNIVEDWTTASGYRAVILHQSQGHMCGYVAVGESHPLYGKKYGEDLPCLKYLALKAYSGPVGKRGVMSAFLGHGRSCMEAVFNVHGSVTFAAGDGQYPVYSQEKLWWIGFDCAHARDTVDFCNQAYVHAECESLAAQILKIRTMDCPDL